MKRLFIIIMALFFAGQLFSQVGINNASPQATLDITAINTTGTSTNVDGLLTPRVDRQRAQSMTGITTSTLIYVNNITTGTQTGIAIDIDETGFYFYDGTKWAKVTYPITPTVAPGTILNTQIIEITGANVSNNSTTFTTVATTNYTPVSNNSEIFVEFYTMYRVNGHNIDSFRSRLTVAGSTISTGEQIFTQNTGGGTRSGVLFPLIGRYTNTALSGLTINAQLSRLSSDDTTTVFIGNSGTWFKITEVRK
ncbi:hypothetical protein QLS71_016200 [Mariniflexile litorale]|uniref:C1q domain-containing protein n=1 Tax=Mariniflexile litorale TaxID=3045158 RepID=A0AAU7EEY0_9FLAO|nr:hypothetical protein [Mariniflexile sp. KMM 9835]MDQ8212312.1 hypothetical protein [Mariniflexile sp. KMM 9835]